MSIVEGVCLIATRNNYTGRREKKGKAGTMVLKFGVTQSHKKFHQARCGNKATEGCRLPPKRSADLRFERLIFLVTDAKSI